MRRTHTRLASHELAGAARGSGVWRREEGEAEVTEACFFLVMVAETEADLVMVAEVERNDRDGDGGTPPAVRYVRKTVQKLPSSSLRRGTRERSWRTVTAA